MKVRMYRYGRNGRELIYEGWCDVVEIELQKKDVTLHIDFNMEQKLLAWYRLVIRERLTKEDLRWRLRIEYDLLKTVRELKEKMLKGEIQ